MKTFNLKQIIGAAINLTALVILGGGAEVAAQITISYPKSTSGYACIGDTIEVTATAAGIDDLVLPKSAYWSGDANDIAIVKEDGKITKRFYTYHPYKEADPTVRTPHNFDFTIRYKNGTTETKTHAITAQSCIPTMNPPSNPPRDVSIGNKYNLGIIYFEFIFDNPSSNPSRIRFVPNFNPDQRWGLYLQRYGTQRKWAIQYHAIPTSDATYAIEVFYNEGDSLNRKISFGPYNIPLKEELGTLEPNATGYCPGNDIEFSLQLSTKWQEVLNQTINNDESKIGSCFDWNGSPAPVTFTRREGSKYFFSTKAVGPAASDYHCKMSVLIKYQSSATRPPIDTSFTHTYDVPVVQPTYHAAAGFTQHEQSVCQGSPLDPSLTQLTASGVTVKEYLDADGQKIQTPGYYVPTKSGAITAVITAPCAWEDKLQVTIVDAAQIQSANIPPDTLVCAGTSLSFSATANSDITWNIMSDDPAETDSWKDTENRLVHTRTFTANAWVTAVVSKCGKSAMREFNVRAVQWPEGVKMSQNAASGCPGTLVNLSGSATSGSNPTYTLYDRRCNKDITKDMQAYITPSGLTDYPLRPNDDLKLTYTVGNTTTLPAYRPTSLTCSSSAEAIITANAQPTVKIGFNGMEYSDGDTACVPRGTAFTLSASGADNYVWLDDPARPTSPNRSLVLTEDRLVSVRGENAQGCADTISLYCAVSVESPARAKSAAVCPGTEFCFEADVLPNTTYAWVGSDGNPIDNKTERLCETLTNQAAGNYTYTLKTKRFTCEESLNYTLTLHPAPDISCIVNPVCVGETLVFNYRTGLPDTEHPQYNFTKDGVSMTTALETLNGDLLRYQKANVQPSDAGRYILKVTTANLCEASDTTDVEVEVPATVRIEMDADTVCEGDQTLLRAVLDIPSDNFTYKWENNNRVIYNAEQSEIQVLWQRADNGPLHLTVQQNACQTKADTVVTVVPTPQLIMPQNTDLCQGETFCLTPVSDIEPEEYRWFCIQGGRMITLPAQDALPYCLVNADASMDGGYIVMVTHVVGSARCYKFSDTTQVTVHPTPDIHIVGPDYVCEQSSVILRAVSYTQGTVRWHHNNSTDEVIEVSEPGLYEVTRITPYGCMDSATHYLEQRPLPYFTLQPHDTALCRGTETMIYGPDDMDFYIWHDGTLGKDYLAETAGEYILTVERNGCAYSDTSHVYMTFCGQFHFPTAFTPNDNRVNDTWGAISSAKDEDMAEFDLMVFDRNGKKVFHGKQISEHWDGTYKGQLCPPGVYTYSFKALEKLEGIQYRTNGTVTIVR